MNRDSRFAFLKESRILILLLLLCASVASAADVVVYYTNQSMGEVRSDVAAVDSYSLNSAQTKALLSIKTLGKPNVRVSCRFTVAAATVKVHLIRCASSTSAPESKSSATATADANFTINGLYVADDLIFDTGGFSDCKIVLETPSSGTVSVVAGPH